MIAVLLAMFMVEFLFLGGSVHNVSAVKAVDGLAVYWDENCSMRVYSIDWGNLSLGEFREIVVYVRNEGNESFLLVLTPNNWNPENVSRYLDFSWSCGDKRVGVRQVVEVTQSLLVSPYTRGVSDFSFDIIFAPAVTDINRDGIVNMRDVAIVSRAYGSSAEDPIWNPDADLNRDGVIDISDVALVAYDFGKTW